MKASRSQVADRLAEKYSRKVWYDHVESLYYLEMHNGLIRWCYTYQEVEACLKADLQLQRALEGHAQQAQRGRAI